MTEVFGLTSSSALFLFVGSFFGLVCFITVCCICCARCCDATPAVLRPDAIKMKTKKKKHKKMKFGSSSKSSSSSSSSSSSDEDDGEQAQGSVHSGSQHVIEMEDKVSTPSEPETKSNHSGGGNSGGGGSGGGGSGGGGDSD
ncbi:hypothetical protein HDE_12068 [Halotydeus destructor]|nr:hypothetical protein HDE_12068 [Halotydeus destructor]